MQAKAEGWHTEKWGTWGWIETVLKLVAIAIGLWSFVRALPLDSFVVSGHPHLAAVIVLALLTLATVAQLVIRLGNRETISTAFAVINFLGHLGLLIALLHLPTYYRPPIAFGVFYVLGQLAKHQFLRVSGYTEGGATGAAMQRTTAILTVAYVVFTILMLL